MYRNANDYLNSVLTNQIVSCRPNSQIRILFFFKLHNRFSTTLVEYLLSINLDLLDLNLGALLIEGSATPLKSNTALFEILLKSLILKSEI